MRHVRMWIFGAALLAVAGIAMAQQDGGRPFSTSLNGAAEVPGPGDPDGRGRAELRINPGQGQVCFTLTVSGIGTPTAAHIHRAVAGQAGPIVVTLTAPSGGSSKDCVNADRELLKNIVQNPSNYYVNVHNADFPAGAIRGQLGR